METNRLEAFSDGVLAIIITIMVLELKVPHAVEQVSHVATLADLKPILPVFLSYVLSFIYIGIYWVNHHHFFHAVHKVSGGLLWANLHLLFWLSLIPFTTAWMGENHFTTWPVAIYGVNLLASAVAYTIAARIAVQLEGPNSEIARALGRDKKGNISLALYTISIPIAFYAPMVSCAIFVLVAMIWFVPDKRIERVLG